MTGGRAPAGALRRYPALAWLAGAVALALLLPSGLNVPNSGPSSLAEYAPVPGQGDGTSDVGELAQASSGSEGFGGPAGGPGATSTTVPSGGSSGRVVRKPGTKRCVGNPPRQTEDPLSPPCVAFFEGDNGGATAKGVTRDEVRVPVHMANAGGPANDGAVVDCAGAPTADEPFFDTLCKAYMRFFNDRYQTYGRTVHLWSHHNASDLEGRFRPFAVAAGSVSTGFARNQTISVGYQGGDRARMQRSAPYAMSFRADNEDRHDMIASFVCGSLVGRPARHAGDPTMHAETRRLGALFSDPADKVPVAARMKELCDAEFVAETDDFTTTAGVARLRAEGVTTVLLFVGNSAHVTATNHASALAWFPEWVVTGPATNYGVDINFFGRQANQAQWANAFGISHDIRRAAISEQPWYMAYRAGCPDCREPQVGETGMLQAASMYDALAMLFYGIQAAGPRLTPANVDKGLHAIPPRASADPFRPAAYFAPGNSSFVKDAMPIWWDPTGQPPGSTAAGCYRLPTEGRRFRTGEWPAGDDWIKAPGPCQGETLGS